MPYVSPAEVEAAREAMDSLGVELTRDVITEGLRAAAVAREAMLRPEWKNYDDIDRIIFLGERPEGPDTVEEKDM